MGKEKVKRVVIDTNVIVSALLFNGLPRKHIPILSVSKFLKEFKLL